MNKPTDLSEVEALVLRKFDYSETSIIAVVLAPTEGIKHFLIKGARKNSKKVFPQIDLFRHVSIFYKPTLKSELNSVRSAECLTIYDAIASNINNFKTAKWLCEFVIRNSKDGVPLVSLFDALKIAFSRLSTPRKVESIPIVLSVCFIMLLENGLLPDYAGDKKTQVGIKKLNYFALNENADFPEFPQETWALLRDWMYKFLHKHAELIVPEGWDSIMIDPEFNLGFRAK